jgi:hypothetical protein
MRKKVTYTNYLFTLLCMVAPTCFGITFPSSGSVPGAFWEMLNWGTVDGILWLGVLFVVTWCVAISYYVTRHNTPIHHILSTAPQLSISQKALGMLPEDGWQCNDETRRSYHTLSSKLNAVSLLFYAQCFNTESMHKVILCHSCV